MAIIVNVTSSIPNMVGVSINLPHNCVTVSINTDGNPGEMGPMPNHQWNGTQLQFETPNGGWGPLVDLAGAPGPNNQNNFQIVKYSASNNETQSHELYNLLPNFIVSDQEIVKFVHTKIQPGSVITRIYDVVFLGAGTYGVDGTPIESNNLLLISTEITSFLGITQDSNNVVIPLGNIAGQNVYDYVNQNGPYVVANLPVITVFSTTEGNYIFIGASGTYGDGELQSTAEDFLGIPNEPNFISNVTIKPIYATLADFAVASASEITPTMALEYLQGLAVSRSPDEVVRVYINYAVESSYNFDITADWANAQPVSVYDVNTFASFVTQSIGITQTIDSFQDFSLINGRLRCNMVNLMNQPSSISFENIGITSIQKFLIDIPFAYFGNNLLTTLDGAEFSNQINEIYFNNNFLTSDAINNFIAQCLAAELTGKLYALDGTGNQPPTGQGITDIAAFVALGNEVYTN